MSITILSLNQKDIKRPSEVEIMNTT